MHKIYLIDGMSLVFRAYHALTGSKLSSPDGEPTSAVFAFTNIITSLLEKENPQKIAVVFDRSEPTFRHIKFPEYKANRPAFPEDLVPQLARIKELLDLLSIPRVEFPGYEADDIIATIAEKAVHKNYEVVCLTSDKDFYQLVNEKVKLYKPSKKSNEDFEVVGIPEVFGKFGVTPDKVIDVLALIGDASDNVPGVKGIGEKTAIPLVQKFGSVEEIYQNLDKIERIAVRTMLEKDREKAFLAKELVTIVRDAPIEIPHDYYEIARPKFNELDKFFAKLGFNTLRQRWHKKADLNLSFNVPQKEIEEIEAIEPAPVVQKFSVSSKKYTFVNTFEKLDSLISELNNAKIISVDTETSSLDRMNCELVGISLSIAENTGFYIAVEDSGAEQNYNGTEPHSEQTSLFGEPVKVHSAKLAQPSSANNGKFTVGYVIEKLKPVLENKNIAKCGQNIKFDAFILRRYGIDLAPIAFDTMVASYILNPDEKHGLDSLSMKWLNYSPIPITALIGEKKATQISMKEVAPEKISDYACEDADIALRLRNIFAIRLEKENLKYLSDEIEFPLIEVLLQMEFNGVAINTAILKDLSKQIDIEIEQLSTKIFQEAGVQFNIDSPKQLGHVLFEKMQIPIVKKNKTGYSTDLQVLNDLSATEPIARLVLDYRQFAKLKSTYIETLPLLINHKTGRIHTNYNQTVAATGRLSSTDPNMQNIPIRTEFGKKIRAAFVPQTPERLILSADYSQIELRIMAFYSRDKHLIESFKNKLDIHAATASQLFDIPLDKVDSNKRRIAKTVNFGIMYGLGAFGLAQRLGISRTEASNIINNYFKKYPGIKKYIDDTIRKTKDKGFAETYCGRRRYFTNINSKNQTLRTSDERAAINLPIQGTAADMMKIAMININSEMQKRKFRSLLILQVHDELVFEIYPDEQAELTELVKEKMQTALPLADIPITVDAGVGANWYESHR
ncbi:MAG: DNA polymerase I [Bacteroidota bacterium]